MSPRFLLRLEGFSVFLAAVAAYTLANASWGLFAGLLLAPDLFMIGYLVGPRIGARVYNAGHTYVAPLLLGGAGYALAAPLASTLALIWAAHIGMDRALGYGLKRPTGFRDTHLNSEDAGVPTARVSPPSQPSSAQV